MTIPITPPLKVTLCAVNLRMGGQVAGLSALLEPLRNSGIAVEIALPDGLHSPTKQALTRFSQKSLLYRVRATLRLLRRLPTGPGKLIHLVVPTPVFAWLVALMPVSPARIIVQSEGNPITWNNATLRDLLDDPWFMLPRFVLNHRSLSSLARKIPVAHVVSTPDAAKMLIDNGFADVTCIPNLAGFSASDDEPLPHSLRIFLRRQHCIVAYIGHAHPVKGVYDVISAFMQASHQRPALSLIIALSADGNANAVHDRIAGLPAAVTQRIYLGGLVAVRRLLTTIDALVLPYRSILTTTLYPSLILEADLADCPLVVSDLPELRCYFNADATRLYRIPPGDTAYLAQTLVRLPYRRQIPLRQSFLNMIPPAVRGDLWVELYRRLDRCARAKNASQRRMWQQDIDNLRK